MRKMFASIIALMIVGSISAQIGNKSQSTFIGETYHSDKCGNYQTVSDMAHYIEYEKCYDFRKPHGFCQIKDATPFSTIQLILNEKLADYKTVMGQSEFSYFHIDFFLDFNGNVKECMFSYSSQFDIPLTIIKQIEKEIKENIHVSFVYRDSRDKEYTRFWYYRSYTVDGKLPEHKGTQITQKPQIISFSVCYYA